jgi:hypothetical protein
MTDDNKDERGFLPKCSRQHRLRLGLVPFERRPAERGCGRDARQAPPRRPRPYSAACSSAGQRAWRREHPEPDQPLSPVERVRVKELEAEVARLRMENEFLKKAAAFFARTHP